MQRIAAAIFRIFLRLLFLPVIIVLAVVVIAILPVMLVLMGIWELIRWLLGWNAEDPLSDDEQRIVKSRRKQNEQLPELQQRLDGLEILLDRGLVGERQRDELSTWLYERFLSYSHRDPDELLESVKDWLTKYEQLQQRHPQVLRLPDPRLAQIGAYFTDPEMREYRWNSPAELEKGPVKFELVFRLESGLFEPDQQMLAIWNTYRARHPVLLADYRRLILEHYGCCHSVDEPNDEEVFDQVNGGTITISRDEEAGERQYLVDVSFDVDWELEHPVGYALDEQCNIVDELQ